MTPADLLSRWLARQLSSQAVAWLDEQRSKLAQASTDRDLFLAVSLAARKLGKDDLQLSAADLRDANSARGHWDPTGWSADQAGRILLLLSARASGEQFRARLDQLCTTADVGELVAFYRGLPLYPDQSLYRLRAAEGVRTNMKSVFEAVAHRNPYPAEQLPEGAWNQMVLKALFVGSILDPIHGLDRRANPALARMLCDYAHERWSAGRPVSPELWRCVGPHADAAALADLSKVLGTGIEAERHAAALALSGSPAVRAAEILRAAPDLAEAVKAGRITWQRLAYPQPSSNNTPTPGKEPVQ